MAFLSGYTYRQKITINADAYISGNLTDFPVAVNVDSSNTSFWGHEDGVGTYVRFTSADEETLLKFQVESYDTTGDDGHWHVQFLHDADANTDIYIYFGLWGG